MFFFQDAKTASQFSEGIFFLWPWNLPTSYVVRPRNYWKVDPPEDEGSELVLPIKLWQKFSKISKISRKLTAGYQKWPYFKPVPHHFGYPFVNLLGVYPTLSCHRSQLQLLSVLHQGACYSYGQQWCYLEISLGGSGLRLCFVSTLGPVWDFLMILKFTPPED